MNKGEILSLAYRLIRHYNSGNPITNGIEYEIETFLDEYGKLQSSSSEAVENLEDEAAIFLEESFVSGDTIYLHDLLPLFAEKHQESLKEKTNFIMENNRILTKREIRNELFGILSMCDAFIEEGSMVGGTRKKEQVKYLPKQIAARIMDLQDLIDGCDLGG